MTDTLHLQQIHSVSIDRGFRPDIAKCAVGSTPLADLKMMGFTTTIGTPFNGELGTRNALWYGEPANGAGELAVIALVGRSAPESQQVWYAGCVPRAVQQPSPELDQATLDAYASYAEHATQTPSSAIALARLLLFGTEHPLTYPASYRITA